MKTHRSRGGRRMAAWLVAVSLLITIAGAAVAAGPSYVPNQLIVKAVPGTTMSQLNAGISPLGWQVVKPVALADTYLVQTGGAASQAGGTLKKRVFSSFAPRPVVQSYSANYYKKPMALPLMPNDEYFDQQWALGAVNCPTAWPIEKGSASVTVAVLDTGVANHPDLQGRLVPGRDFYDNDADPSDDTDGHGTFCAGEIAAQGDNSIGICGVCWDGVNIMPVRLGTESGWTTDTAIAGMDWAETNHANVFSMSYGGPPGLPDAAEQAKVTEVASHNIIMVAAAGNSGDSGDPAVSSPALCPEVIAVAAIGPNDEISYYSSYGPGYEVDIAAPGGDDSLGIAATTVIFGLTVDWVGGVPEFGYDYLVHQYLPFRWGWEGTSMACPMVSGAAALLLSAGVPPTEVRSRLEGSARKPKGLTMDKMRYGNGILDVAKALTNGSIAIAKPVKGSTVTATPDFKINVSTVKPDSLAVYIDYADDNNDDLPDDLAAEQPVLSGQVATGFINTGSTSYSFNWSDISATPLSAGFHLIYVKATPVGGGPDVYDWGSFVVSSRVIPQGTYLIALPYDAPISQVDGLRHPLPQELLWDASTSQPLEFRNTMPNRSRLLRWSAVDNSYLEYLPLSTGDPALNDRSWVNVLSPTYGVATGGGFLPADTTALKFPAGSGFWLILQKDAVMNASYPVISAPGGFNTILYKGWNLIGNPISSLVYLSSIRLVYQGKVRTLDEDAVAPVHWVQPIFYGYSTTTGRYVAVPARGVLEAYQGYWLRALVGGTHGTDQLVMFAQ